MPAVKEKQDGVNGKQVVFHSTPASHNSVAMEDKIVHKGIFRKHEVGVIVVVISNSLREQPALSSI